MSRPTQLFGRTARLTLLREKPVVGTSAFTGKSVGEQITIENLRIKFKIERSLSKHPDVCDINVYNLSDRSRIDVESKPLRVQLDAGYRELPRLMFVGDLRFAMTELANETWDTLLQCGDGDRAHFGAKLSKSYGAGTPIKQVLKDVAGTMGLVLPKNVLQDPALDAQFSAGKHAHGRSRDLLASLLSPYGYTYTRQGGQIVVLRENETSPGEAIPISEKQGMIGTPEFGSPPKSGKPPHIKVKLALYPELCPGQTIDLNSRFKKGLFRIEKARHEGDTMSKDGWVTEIEIKPLSEAGVSGTAGKAVFDPGDGGGGQGGLDGGGSDGTAGA